VVHSGRLGLDLDPARGYDYLGKYVVLNPKEMPWQTVKWETERDVTWV
jgi:hypothetical protein